MSALVYCICCGKTITRRQELEHRKLTYVLSPIQEPSSSTSSIRRITSLPVSSDEDLSDEGVESLHSTFYVPEPDAGIPMDIHLENVYVLDQDHDSTSSAMDEDTDFHDASGQGGDEKEILEYLTSQDRNPHVLSSSESLSEGEDNMESTGSDNEERFLHFPDWESYEHEDSFGMDGLKEGFEKEAAALGMSPFLYSISICSTPHLISKQAEYL